jgi:hypothetical protein
MHLLLNQALNSNKPSLEKSNSGQMLKPLLSSRENSFNSSKEESKAEYEVISTDTSQESMDVSVIMPDLDLFPKESCPVKIAIYESISKHAILSLHLKLSEKLCILRPDSPMVLKDLSKLVNQAIEDPADKNPNLYKLFDDCFLFQALG